jgi:hypothetical protein
MSKHTPASWIVRDVFIENFPNKYMITENKWGGKTIADCGITVSQESIANARLMAASPELFHIVTEFLECGDNAGHNEELKALARAAIAKARG